MIFSLICKFLYVIMRFCHIIYPYYTPAIRKLKFKIAMRDSKASLFQIFFVILHWLQQFQYRKGDIFLKKDFVNLEVKMFNKLNFILRM